MTTNAVFPNGIVQFVDKRDHEDVNYASDINRLQAEVTAIEQTLGALITTVQTLKVNSAGKATTLQNEYETLAQLIRAAGTGQLNPVATTGSTGTVTVPPSPPTSPPTQVNLPEPPSGCDPEDIWDGEGVTIPRSGFWRVEASATITNPGLPWLLADAFYDYDADYFANTLNGRFSSGNRLALVILENGVVVKQGDDILGSIKSNLNQWSSQDGRVVASLDPTYWDFSANGRYPHLSHTHYIEAGTVVRVGILNWHGSLGSSSFFPVFPVRIENARLTAHLIRES